MAPCWQPLGLNCDPSAVQIDNPFDGGKGEFAPERSSVARVAATAYEGPVLLVPVEIEQSHNLGVG
jgi:hypothetical protein